MNTARSARTWPWGRQWPGDEEWRLARYVHDCTRPEDRLLVTWAAPEYYVFSRRVFAGGEAVLFPVFRQPATYEPSVLARWKRQRVPIVLTSAQTYRDFATTYPALAAHLETAYTTAGVTHWDGRSDISVHVDRRLVSAGRDAEFGLPCFVEAAVSGNRQPVR